MINIEQVSQVTIGKNAVRFTAVRLSVGIGQYIAMISTVVRPYLTILFSKTPSFNHVSPTIRQIGFYFD